MDGIIIIRYIFDREKISYYNFIVIVVDGGNFIVLIVIVIILVIVLDRNDVILYFDFDIFEFIILEEVVNLIIIGFVKVKDEDYGANGNVIFVMDFDFFGKMFFLFKLNGEIKSIRRFDRE